MQLKRIQESLMKLHDSLLSKFHRKLVRNDGYQKLISDIQMDIKMKI